MKSPRLFSRCAPLLALGIVPVLGGCVFIKQPAPEPTPTPVATPSPDIAQFDPAEGSPEGTALNKQEGGEANPALPDSFRAALIVSGQELVLQSVKSVPKADGTPQVILGAADSLNPVHLAGIVVPVGNQTGAGEAIDAIQKLIAGKDLDVDIDPVFPTDTDNKRRVQIFFKARDAPFTGERMSLNRMLVRSGNAIVDLYSPTSFDQSQWLYDETYARENNQGLWKTDTFRRLQQRVKLPSKGTGAKANVVVTTNVAPAPALVAPGAPGEAATTTTTTTTDPAAAGMPASPMSPPPPGQ